MSDLLSEVLCWLGVGHAWKTVYEDGPRVVQRCVRCCRLRSTRIDRTLGCTYWVAGDYWGNKP